MHGYVEKVTEDGVKGWAANIETPEQKTAIRVLLGKKTLMNGETGQSRPDVSKALSIPNGPHGYSIRCHIPNDKSELVSVEAFNGSRWVPLKKILNDRTGKMLTTSRYQSFDNEGASKSYEKLLALRLDDFGKNSALGESSAIFEGKSVLDIGCNEGYFCVEAVKYGASRVLGIDTSAKFIEMARNRCPEAEFKNISWWDIPDERFDVIFFLSAIHYENDPKKLLHKLCDHLTDDGVLVLECGVAPGNHQKSWYKIVRFDAERRYPYLDYLVDDILQDYSTRFIGPSVAQKGDPIPRYVFHCRPKKPIAVLVGGASYSGKTDFVKQMRKGGFSTYATDLALHRLVNDGLLQGSKLYDELSCVFRTGRVVDLGKIGRYIVDNNFSGEFVDFLISEIPMDSDVLFLEGEILRYQEISDKLTQLLISKNIKVWTMNPV